MAQKQLNTQLGRIALRSPLIAASGTVGSVWEWLEVADPAPFGAAVAKSVAPEAWTGRHAPRLAPLATGMLNGIGIQNPGIEEWANDMSRRLPQIEVPVWGSVVGHDPSGFAGVARTMSEVGVTSIEVNLSCPNLDDGTMFSFDPVRSAEVVAAVVTATDLPVGAKLSPNTPDLVRVARACAEAGANHLVLTNTALGFGVDIATGRPLITGGVGGYSGPGIKPLSLRCVFEVATALPDLPIVGCGGVSSGRDVAEYLIAGASAVAVGTTLLGEPRAGTRILREFERTMSSISVGEIADLRASVKPW